MNGIGAHEVIIETPHHEQTLATMREAAIEKVFWAWRERVLDLKRDIRLRHIVIFKNHGAAAGASLEHSHSQLIALPIVPRELKEELDGAKRHFQQRERCVFCDIVRQEVEEWHAGDRRVGRLRGDCAVRAAISVRDVAACPSGIDRGSRTRRPASSRAWRGC